MPFIPLQPPAGLDTDGLRKHGEDQHREIARAWTEVEKSITTGATDLAALTAAVAAIQAAYVTTIATLSGAFTLNGTSGITNTVNDIKLSQATAAQFGAVKVDGTTILASAGVIRQSHSPITASLGADVALNNVNNYFDGPSIAQGTSGTWFASGTITLRDTSGASAAWRAKLWDGTTVIASCVTQNYVASGVMTASLSGFIINPVGNIRISARDLSSASGAILANLSTESKDSTITAIRIA